jgi:hypothetical protein
MKNIKDKMRECISTNYLVWTKRISLHTNFGTNKQVYIPLDQRLRMQTIIMKQNIRL